MMFMSMIIASVVLLIVAFVVIVIIPLAIGLPLLITGIVRRKKYLAAGVKPRKASIIAGSIFCGIPAAAFLLVAIMFIVGLAKIALNDMRYSNVVEYWKNSDRTEFSMKWEYCDIREEFLKAAENGDREALVALYSDNAKARPGFDKQIDEFMFSYQKGFLSMLRKGRDENLTTRTNVKPYVSLNDEDCNYDYHDILYFDNGKAYGMLFISCDYYTESDKKNMGMQYVRIYSGDIAADELLTGERKPLTAASFEVNDNPPADLKIIGNEISHTDSDSPVIDLSVMLKSIKEIKNIDDFTEFVGKPLAVWKSSDTSVWQINPDISDIDDDGAPVYFMVTYPDGEKIMPGRCCLITSHCTIYNPSETLEFEEAA